MNNALIKRFNLQHIHDGLGVAGQTVDSFPGSFWPARWLIARLSAGIWDLHGYINQPARASQLVPAGAYRDRDRRGLRPGPGPAVRAGTTWPGARAYTTITHEPGRLASHSVDIM